MIHLFMSTHGLGRYVSPEPLLQPGALNHDPELLTLSPELHRAIVQLSYGPGYLVNQSEAGLTAPSYSYALGNPMAFVDPDGLFGRGPEQSRGSGGVQSSGSAGAPLCAPGDNFWGPGIHILNTAIGKCIMGGAMLWAKGRKAGLPTSKIKAAVEAYMKSCIARIPKSTGN